MRITPDLPRRCRNQLAALGVDGTSFHNGNRGAGAEVREERAAAVSAELADHVVARVAGVDVFFGSSGDRDLVLQIDRMKRFGVSETAENHYPSPALTFIATRLTENAAPDVLWQFPQ